MGHKLMRKIFSLVLLLLLNFNICNAGDIEFSNIILSSQVGINLPVPLQESELISWLDFSDTSRVLTVDSRVKTIIDKSPQNNNYTNAIVDERPFYTDTMNGLNVATFSFDKLRAESIVTKTTNATLYFVIASSKPSDGNNTFFSNDFFGFGSIDFRIGVPISTFPLGRLTIFRNDNTPNRQGGQNGSVSVVDSNLHILALYFDGFDLYLRSDSTIDTFLATNIAGIFRGSTPGLGEGFNGGAAFEGFVGEMIIYKKTLLPNSTADLKIFNYLKDKWGL